jgi:hypothetical protein
MIDFKLFLSEEESESTIVESVVDSLSYGRINDILYTELEKNFLSPEAGFSEIKKILLENGIDLPLFFDIDPDGDEVVLDMTPYGGQMLYVLYSLSDEGYYEFYAEITDDAGIEKLLSSGGEDQEE